MENYIIYVNNVGFFESMGHNGITYTKEINKAFQTSLKSAREIMRAINTNSDGCCILKICG